MMAFRPVESFVHDFVSFTREVQALTHAHKHKHTYILRRTDADVCSVMTPDLWVSPEGCVTNKKSNSDPVPAQLDSVRAGRHVSAEKHIRLPREARV